MRSASSTLAGTVNRVICGQAGHKWPNLDAMNVSSQCLSRMSREGCTCILRRRCIVWRLAACSCHRQMYATSTCTGMQAPCNAADVASQCVVPIASACTSVNTSRGWVLVANSLPCRAPRHARKLAAKLSGSAKHDQHIAEHHAALIREPACADVQWHRPPIKLARNFTDQNRLCNSSECLSDIKGTIDACGHGQ